MLAHRNRFELRITLTKDPLGLFERLKYEVKEKRRVDGWTHLGIKGKACIMIDSRDEEEKQKSFMLNERCTT